MNFLKFLMGSYLLMDKAGEGGGGGGGGSDPTKEIADLKTQNAELLKRLDALEKKGNPNPNPNTDPKDKDLADKAKAEREAAEAKAKGEKATEAALNFNIRSKDFIKDNAHLLPKNIAGLFDQAEKENYGSAVEKANDIKAGIISEFFAIQANHDQLTGPQKIEVDNFLKLTKNGKQEKVESVYAMIFEPTLDMLRKIEKAKQLNNGDKNQTEGEKAIAERMMKLSRQHYLGEKAQ